MDLYFAKVPLRNTYLRLRNRFAKGDLFSNFMRRYDVNLVLDVGANKGQYARHLIRSGYRGRMISFEPLPSAFQKLRLNRWGFADWQVEPFALGAEHATATFNIAANSQSSSLQEMLPAHVAAAPGAAYVDQCQVQVRRLDDVFSDYYRAGDRCYLKLDVQGHEHHVLSGAAGCLDRIIAVQLELSIAPLYDGEQCWQQAIETMRGLGFRLMVLTPGFSDSVTGEMLQADGVFIRDEAVQSLKAA